MKIKALEIGYDMKEATKILYDRSKQFEIKNMKLLYYPYLKAEYQIDMGEKLQRFNDKALCMVDLCTGRQSVAKSQGKFVEVTVEEKYLMPIKLTHEEALDGIVVEIGSAVMAKRKVLKIPDIYHLTDEEVYKPFYIVECINNEKEIFFVLFDAVMGDFSLINA